jgi:hypothetical protein
VDETCPARKRPGQNLFAWGVLSLLAIYTALAWSPSSYGLVFDRLGVERVGLVFGEPREIRADEWVRWTPLIQAAVRNDFRRINATSFYREDLRSVEGLPLWDWGLVFKPSFWGFFVLDPAHAFSLHHAFWIGAFLIGFERLLRAIGARPTEAALGSVALFFSSFAQMWWTTYGPILGGFPWLVLALLSPLRASFRAAFAAYVATAWTLACLYPPIEVTLAFAAAVAVIALRPDALAPRRLAPFLIAVLVGAALSFVYYQDMFAVMAETLYPGLRRSSGGGRSFEQWLSQFLPAFVIEGSHARVAENICEASTVGTFLPLIALFFADGGDLARRLRSKAGRRLALSLGTLFTGVLLTSVWLLAPVPQALGRPLLWHLVPPERMWFAGGLLIFLLSLTVLRHARLRLSWGRFAGLFALLLAAHLVAHRGFRTGGLGLASGAAFLAVVAGVVASRERLRGAALAVLIGAAALSNAIAFAGFNPVQSSVPIFDPPPTPGATALASLAARHPKNWLVMSGSDGAWLNGLGYPSPSHILYAPQLARFRALFPDLEESSFQQIFNRTLYLTVTPRRHPVRTGEVMVELPIELFDPTRIRVTLHGERPNPEPFGGFVERSRIFQEVGRLQIVRSGWAPMDGADAASSLEVYSTLPVTQASAYPVLRGDVARSQADPGLALSGFVVQLTLAEQASWRPLRALAGEPICIVSDSPSRGRFLLRSEGRGACVIR